MPGWIEESVGYHTDDGNIFHNADDPDAAIITEGRKPCEQHTTAQLALLSEHRSSHPRRSRGSQSSREKRWDEIFQVRADRRALGYRLSPDNFQKFQQMRRLIRHKKMLCIIVPNRRTHLMSSCVFVCSYTTAIVSITACLAHAPKKCTQSGNVQFDMKSPSDFKILSARKLYKESLFQKYKLQLTTGILIFFSIYRDYSNSLTLPNACELFWSWISINHIQVHKENELCHCLFTSFTKREIRHFLG